MPSAPEEKQPDKPVKRHPFTWERVIDVVKLIATVWVALIGSFVTMQFNERQHELNRIEAISQMLPHMDSGNKTPDEHMGRDGAIWAIFRTANNRKMLRDLASLFPEDIYRVVSSIAVGGELDHDQDAIVALQVASEKLAAEFSNDPKKAELASKLYAQALILKERKENDPNPLRVVDLSASMDGSAPTDDQLTALIRSINNLADMHLKEISSAVPATHKKRSGTNHWQCKQLYLRARRLGQGNEDDQVLEQVARADLSLAGIYILEQLSDDAYKYLKEALAIEAKITGKPSNIHLNTLDKDNDGYAKLPELEEAIELAQERLKAIIESLKDKGASMKTAVSPGNTAIPEGNAAVSAGNGAVAPANTKVAPATTKVPPASATVPSAKAAPPANAK